MCGVFVCVGCMNISFVSERVMGQFHTHGPHLGNGKLKKKMCVCVCARVCVCVFVSVREQWRHSQPQVPSLALG